MKRFLIEGTGLALISLLLIGVYYKTGKYIIHPTLYIVTLIMGIGWGVTALSTKIGGKHDK